MVSGLTVGPSYANFYILAALANRQTLIDQTSQRIATGLRINTAGDDPAGLSLATKLQSTAAGYTTARANAQNASSLLTSADTAASTIQSLVSSIRSVIVSSMSGGLSDAQLDALQEQLDTLVRTLDNTAKTTSFNGRPLLSKRQAAGTDPGVFTQTTVQQLTIQTGPDSGSSNQLTIKTYDMSAYGMGLSSSSTSYVRTLVIGSAGTYGGSSTTRTQALDLIDGTNAGGANPALNSVTTFSAAMRTSMGAYSSAISAIVTLNTNQATNFTNAANTILNADTATETTNLSALQIAQQAGAALLTQLNANRASLIALLLGTSAIAV